MVLNSQTLKENVENCENTTQHLFTEPCWLTAGMSIINHAQI